MDLIKELREHEARLRADPVIQARKKEAAAAVRREQLRFMVPAGLAAAVVVGLMAWAIQAGMLAHQVNVIFGSSFVFGPLAGAVLVYALKLGSVANSALVRGASWTVCAMLGLYLLALIAVLSVALFNVLFW